MTLTTIFSGLTNVGFPTASNEFVNGDFLAFSTPNLGGDEGYEISLVIVADLPAIGEKRLYEAIADTADLIRIPQEIGRRGLTLKAYVATPFAVEIEIHVGLFEIASDREYIQTFTQDDLTLDAITITHNLNTIAPLVQVYDGNAKQTLRGTVTVIDANSIELDFSSEGGAPDLVGTYTVRVG
jgi:hypothetical protein